ncbi:MAG: hypothetical protein JOY70_11295 [Acidisphaera sp.]|nr:hypothetical protein [Acidisphaera sp.]
MTISPGDLLAGKVVVVPQPNTPPNDTADPDAGNGDGLLVRPNGETVGGHFATSKPDGFVAAMSGAEAYVGDFAAGVREGVGLYVEADGTAYQGHWHAGRPNGEGTMYDADGNVVASGTWSDGCAHGGAAVYSFGPPIEHCRPQ